jgi:high-affinity nickel-transport protein
MSLFLTFITSLMLGMRHATDPDHIVAVTTIVSRERSVVKAAGIGAVWGLGHTITLLIVGGAIIAFKIAFNARLGLSLELSVAIMLIVLGLLNIFDVRAGARRISTSRPFFVGIVHGLAGSAAAVLIVPSSTMRWAHLSPHLRLRNHRRHGVGYAGCVPSLLATAHAPACGGRFAWRQER